MQRPDGYEKATDRMLPVADEYLTRNLTPYEEPLLLYLKQLNGEYKSAVRRYVF